jgi:hypothetical protein
LNKLNIRSELHKIEQIKYYGFKLTDSN